MALTLEERLTHLEHELEQVKKRLPEAPTKPKNWLDQVFGSFKDDPIYEEAMRLRREFRDSQQQPDDIVTDVPS
jgi:hypothetical protein